MNKFIYIFPKTKIIVHIRQDIVKQSQSSWWEEDANSTEIIKKNNQVLIDYYTSHTNFTYLSTFEDLFDMNKLRSMFKFLGKEHYFNEKEIKIILNNNLG